MRAVLPTIIYVPRHRGSLQTPRLKLLASL